MRSRLTLLVAGLLFAGSDSALANDAPARVVSLDYCADQFVLKLLPRSRILAVSPDADTHFSYMRETATGIWQVRPLAEDVLSIGPDLVVTSYGGGPNAATFFERAGVPVLQVPIANDIEGIRRTIMEVASGLGDPEKGWEIVQEMNARLAAIPQPDDRRTVLYLTPTGVTSGPGTLIDEMILAAGHRNFEQRDGWHSIPLERLAYTSPDIAAGAFFDENANHAGFWSAMRHPLARRQMQDLPTVMLQGAWTSCGGWFLLDAIEALAAVRNEAR